MIYLHTLGDALIKIGEKEIRPTSPLLFAALLYLGLERGRRVPRAALQELLFPNADERSGAHSLRQLLYKLRQLGAPIEADGNVVLLRTEEVQDDRAADTSLTNGNAKHAERFALGLLPDYAPNLSERYDEWLEHQRASVSASVRRQLVAAMSASRNSIDWTAVERFAQLILQIDPFNEEATLALAEASALLGSKAMALTLLTRYEQETGRSDLKIAPSLLRRRISDRVPDARPVTLDTPFVGRSEDAESLLAAIRGAKGGYPCLAVITGEPGIGKTRLLQETASLVALEGVNVQTVRCRPHYLSRPFGVFIELVPSLLSCRGALGVSPRSLEALNLLISHTDDRVDRPTDARDIVTRSGILFAALRDLIDAVLSETPLLLAIEDVHWADPDSLREISALVQSNPGRRLSVVLTARGTESLELNRVIAESTYVKKLAPLGEEPMAQLTRYLLNGSVNEGTTETLTAWCVKTASGNPLFLQTLCAHHVATGKAFLVPPDLLSAIRRRIQQLPKQSRRILEFSALLGTHSTLDAIQSMAECGHLDLLNGVQNLEEEGFLQLNGDAVRTRHDLLSECALSLVPPLTRRVLHRCVALNLERRYDASHDASLLWDCTEQWRLSGESDKAIQFLKRCARHAVDLGRASQALTLLQQAKDLARYPSETADVLTEMMLASKASGKWSETLEYSKQLSSLDDGSVRHSDAELLTIEASWMMSFKAGDATARLVACAAAVDASATHRLDAASVLLRIAHERGDFALGHQAYTLVETLLEADLTSYSCRIVPLIYHTSFGSRDKALATARELLKDLPSFRSVASQFRAGMNVATAFAFLGWTDDAISVYNDFYDRAGALSMSEWQWDFATSLCWQYLQTEDIPNAAEWYARAESSRTPSTNTVLARKHAAIGCELALRRGDIPFAREMLVALRQFGAAESVRVAAYMRSYEIRIEQIDPGWQASDYELQELKQLFEACRALVGIDYLAVALGEGLRRRGRLREAADFLAEYAKYYRREQSPLPPSFVRLSELCGVPGAADLKLSGPDAARALLSAR